MNPTKAQAFRQLCYDRSGLALTEAKDYLLLTRLEPVARAEGCGHIDELLDKALASPGGPVAQRCIDAMATHESFFFRDGGPFEQLREKVLPGLIEACAQKRALRIWSAACSSGQEPYSLAMLLLEERHRMPEWDVTIVATDMSEPILDRARTGRYSEFEARRGLSDERRMRWMTADGGGFKVAPQVRDMVEFRHHNLLDGVSMLGRFDLIFCRNVLIYFDMELKTLTLERIAKILEPHGVVIMGSAESVVGLQTPFAPRPGLRGVYQLSSAPPAIRKSA